MPGRFVHCGKTASLLVIKQIEVPVCSVFLFELCIHDVFQVLHVPSFILDDDGRTAGGVDKVICH